MRAASRSIIFVSLVALALIVAACNGDSDDDAVVTDDADTTTATDDAADVEETPDDAMTDDAVTEDEDPADDVTADDAEVAEETPVTQETPEADDATLATDDTDDAVAEDPDEILENAAQRTEELNSARFELDGTGYLEVEEIGEVRIENAEGAIERPGRAQVEFDVDLDAMEVPFTVVSIDGDVYFTDVFTGEWQRAPDEFDFNPVIIFDADDGIPALIRSVENAEILEEEEIDGRQTYKIYGVIDADTIRQGTAGMFRADEDVDFNVWIDQETYDVVQVRAEDPTGETTSVWEMRIFDHDEEVEIEDPTADDS